MQNAKSNGSRGFFARGFAALGAVAAIGLGLMASPVSAAPFAYVANSGDNTVSVIDTATNPPAVVATIPVGGRAYAVAVSPDGKHAYVLGSVVSVIDTASNTVVATVPVYGRSIAITPDGKHAYVTNDNFPAPSTVSVIATANNTVVATIPVGGSADGVAITPDGKHTYVTGNVAVSVIDTASNTVVATVPVVGGPIAITPDSKHAYVLNHRDNNVSVIDTAGNTVVATVTAGVELAAVSVAPDGKHAYVTSAVLTDIGPPTRRWTQHRVFVIDTASNTVVATVGVGPVEPFGSSTFPGDVAITPDGKNAYVTSIRSNLVVVIDTASNAVVATVAVGSGPGAVGIVPPPPGIPFLAFSAQLAIQFGGTPNQDAFNLNSQFTLSSTASNGIKPVTEAVKVQVGTFTTTIPPGSFRKQPNGSFTFAGVIRGVSLQAQITPAGTLRYAFHAAAQRVSLAGTKNPVYVTLIIGGDSGATSVNADIVPPLCISCSPFSAQLAIQFGGAPNQDAVNLQSQFTLSRTASINPVTEAVKLQVGAFATTIPPGSFRRQPNGSFTFAGGIGGVALQAQITPAGTLRYAFHASAQRASLTGTHNPVQVTLIIGANKFVTSVTAWWVPPPAFSAQLAIHVGSAPNEDVFNLNSQFTLSRTASINPVTEAVTLQVGTFTINIPPGSFRKLPDGLFAFAGMIAGFTVAIIEPRGTKRYAFGAAATGASLTGTHNPVQVTLIIGANRFVTSVNAGTF